MAAPDQQRQRWHPESGMPSSRLLITLTFSIFLHVVLILMSGGSGLVGKSSKLSETHSPGVNESLPLVLEVTLPGKIFEQTAVETENMNSARVFAAGSVRSMSIEQDMDGQVGHRRASEESASTAEQRRLLAKASSAQEADLAARMEREEAATRTRQASYTLASLLDVLPVPLNAIRPEYPASAKNQQGKVVLQLFINENGDVEELIVARATPPGFFEDAAKVAFAPARFSPGMRFGRAVKSQLAVEVDFVPFNRGANVSGGGY
jgi:TonB family protein